MVVAFLTPSCWGLFYPDLKAVSVTFSDCIPLVGNERKQNNGLNSLPPPTKKNVTIKNVPKLDESKPHISSTDLKVRTISPTFKSSLIMISSAELKDRIVSYRVINKIILSSLNLKGNASDYLI